MRAEAHPLATARRLQDEAAAEGFDWTELDALFAKLDEELAELREARTQGEARVRDEFGDVLFVIVNLARHLRVDPEQALDQANAKFTRRYAVVQAGREQWASLGGEARLAAMEVLWQQAKRQGL